MRFWLLLFVLVDCFECFVKVVVSGVDVIIFDLEDLVVLLWKVDVWDVVWDYLVMLCDVIWLVWINLVDIGYFVDDIVVVCGVDVIMLFKVEGVMSVDVLLYVWGLDCLLILLIVIEMLVVIFVLGEYG